MDCWQGALRRALRRWDDLAAILELPPESVEAFTPDASNFPLFVTREFASRMRRRDPVDPLLLQVLPRQVELLATPGYTTNPVGDAEALMSPGLLRKYANRALMVVTGACAIHCRYCFRRHFAYEDLPRDREAWQPALEQLRAATDIDEVILSGGDPLMLVDSRLEILIHELASIRHLRRLRLHTRLPIVLPQRVTPELLALLTQSRLTPIVVVHVNHAQEIDASVEQAFSRFLGAGIPLLNQAVLLRGINDSTDALVALSQRLVDLRVMPYYLHLLDRVAGAEHFDVSLEEGQVFVAEMRKRLSGYAVPRLVREEAGRAHKTVLA